MERSRAGREKTDPAFGRMLPGAASQPLPNLKLMGGGGTGLCSAPDAFTETLRKSQLRLCLRGGKPSCVVAMKHRRLRADLQIERHLAGHETASSSRSLHWTMDSSIQGREKGRSEVKIKGCEMPTFNCSMSRRTKLRNASPAQRDVMRLFLVRCCPWKSPGRNVYGQANSSPYTGPDAPSAVLRQGLHPDRQKEIQVSFRKCRTA